MSACLPACLSQVYEMVEMVAYNYLLLGSAVPCNNTIHSARTERTEHYEANESFVVNRNRHYGFIKWLLLL